MKKSTPAPSGICVNRLLMDKVVSEVRHRQPGR
jgi:hypothetical protein